MHDSNKSSGHMCQSRGVRCPTVDQNDLVNGYLCVNDKVIISTTNLTITVPTAELMTGTTCAVPHLSVHGNANSFETLQHQQHISSPSQCVLFNEVKASSRIIQQLMPQ